MKQTWQPWDEKSRHGLNIESELIGEGKNPLKVKGQCSSREKKSLLGWEGVVGPCLEEMKAALRIAFQKTEMGEEG